MTTAPQRFFVVGTNTGIGKTAVTCALLQWARHHAVRVIPFKPAQSGAPGDDDDVHRLLRAACVSPTFAHAFCPLQYAEPLAPGIADDPAPFISNAPSSERPLNIAREALDALERHYVPDLVFIEGAGGLHVPMPGGTWQLDWIAALGASPLIVADSGLGTINHTLLTIDALRARKHDPIGFYFSSARPDLDPSTERNASVIARARGLQHLGTLPHQSQPDSPGDIDLLGPLLNLIDHRPASS